MSTGVGWQVPRRHDRYKRAARRAGHRGMDTLPSPRAITSHVNAIRGAPRESAVPRHPRRYTPKGRAPVSAY